MASSLHEYYILLYNKAKGQKRASVAMNARNKNYSVNPKLTNHITLIEYVIGLSKYAQQTTVF